MTGEIISKTAAADNTVKLLPEHGGLLARAKAPVSAMTESALPSLKVTATATGSTRS